MHGVVARLRWIEDSVGQRCEGTEHSYLTTRRLWQSNEVGAAVERSQVRDGVPVVSLRATQVCRLIDYASALDYPEKRSSLVKYALPPGL